MKIIISNVDCNWFVGGDLNNILTQYEKRGKTSTSYRKCALFQDIINNCNLMDLGSNGYKYNYRGPISHGGLEMYERF